MEDGGAGTTIANHGFTHTMDKLEVDEPRSRGKESADAQRRRTCTCAHKTRVRVAENVGLAIVIVIVWSLLLLPVIFYHLPNNLGDTNSTQFVNLSGGGMMESCDHVTQQKYVSVCSFQDSRLGREQAAINPISYKGSVCWEELSSLKSCLLSDDSSENSHPLVVTIDGEGDAELALSAVDTFASPECAVEVKPFLCLYFFGLMSDTSYNVYYQPSAEHCVNLRDDVCEMEWNLAQVLISGLKLPDCNEQLPSRIEPCNENQEGGLDDAISITASGSGSSGSGLLLPLNDTITFSTTVSGAPTQQQSLSPGCNNITCREGFYCIERDNGSHGYCNPSCYSWNQYPRTTNIVVDFMVLMSVCIGIVAGIGVLVAAVVRRKNVFVFPSPLAVYQIITVFVVALFIVVSYVDNQTLYCTSENLYTSFLNEATAFCVITGAVMYYALFQLAIFWLSHVLVLFWGLKFPFHWRRFKSSPTEMRYLHLTCVVTGLLGPFIPVIATMSQFAHGKSTAAAVKGGLGFGITRLPSLLCNGRDEATTFYALVLPIIVIIMIGMPLLVLVFWIIHKQHGLFKEKQFVVKKSRSRPFEFKIGAAERKILIAFTYYVLLAAISLVTFSLSIRHTEPFINKVLEYFNCESGGVDPNDPDHCDSYITSYLKHRQVALISLSHVLLGLYPVVNLIYVVNIRELKEYVKKWLPCRRRKVTL